MLQLRIGIMCNNMVFEAWQANCLKKLIENENIKISLLIINGGMNGQVPIGNALTRFYKADFNEKMEKIKRFISKKRLWNLYKKYYVDRRVKATMPIDMSCLLNEVPQIICKTTLKGKYSQHFDESDFLKISEYKLDVILRFGFSIIKGSILKAAQYGVWSFHHDDEEKYRGGPPCFWEIYHNDPVTGAILQRLTDRLDGGIILYKGYYRTLGSYIKNKNRTYFGSAEWPAIICNKILSNHNIQFKDLPSTTKAPVYLAPTNKQMCIFFLKKIKSILSGRIKNLFFEKRDIWNIGISNCPINTFLSSSLLPEIHWLPEKGHSQFIADPFVIKKSGKTFIFAERYSYLSNKGEIVYMESLDNNTFSSPRKAIDLAGHASYPYLLRYRDEVYCIPETSSLKEINLYKASNFPKKWEQVRTLIGNIQASDATIIFYKGFWWLFCIIHTDYHSHESLFIWYSPDLFGSWQPHLLNPVKTDIRSARPAGTPFIYNDDLYRPAQNCSLSYGGSVAINRVIEISPTTFHEEIAAIVSPPKLHQYFKGLHTISHTDNITVLDAKKEIWIRKRLFKKLN